ASEGTVGVDLAGARARRDAKRANSTPLDAPEPEDRAERTLESWQVQDAISRLAPSHRRVLVEMYYRGRAGAELADELGIPEGTVRSRLYYALRGLRRQLEDMGWSS